MPTVPLPRKPGAKAGTQASATETTETTDSRETGPQRQAKAKRAKPRATTDDRLRESLEGMYTGLGMVVGAIGMPVAIRSGDARLLTLGSQLSDNSAQFADAWLTWASRNSRVKAILAKVVEGGAAAEVIAVHMTLILPFLPGLPGPAATPDPVMDMSAFVPDSSAPTVPVGPFADTFPIRDNATMNGPGEFIGGDGKPIPFPASPPPENVPPAA